MNNSEIPFSTDEVARLDGESYYSAFIRVFNNFLNLFPLGDKPYRSGNPLGSSRSVEMQRWETIRKDTDIGVFGDNDPSCDKYSGKYRNQTPREFYAEIDAISLRLGVPIAKVAEIVNAAYIGSERRTLWKRRLENRIPFYRRRVEARREARWKLMFVTLVPIYTELRRRGYSRGELIR